MAVETGTSTVKRGLARPAHLWRVLKGGSPQAGRHTVRF